MVVEKHVSETTPALVTKVRQQALDKDDYKGEDEKTYYIRFITMLAHEKHANNALANSLHEAMVWSLAALTRKAISEVAMSNDLQKKKKMCHGHPKI